jgi:GntR family transcriptional regulator
MDRPLGNISNKRTAVAQVKDELLALISERRFVAGDQIPTEAELAAMFGASRPTIREALKLLEQTKVINVVHGQGRYLTAAGSVRIDRPITEFESLTQMARHLGYNLQTKLISVAEEIAPSEIASRLSLGNEKTVIRLERIRLHEGVPAVYCIEHVRCRAIPKPIFDVDWSGSLLDLLDKYAHRPSMASAKVSAVMLPDEVIRRNGLTEFGPALLIEETAYLPSGVPVLHAQNYHRGGLFSFSLMRE